MKAKAAIWAPLLWVALAASAQADADGPDFYRLAETAPSEGVPLRSAASTEAELLAVLPAGTDGLANLGCEGRLSFAEWEAASAAERSAAADRVWCRVRTASHQGWVPGRHLVEGQAP